MTPRKRIVVVLSVIIVAVPIAVARLRDAPTVATGFVAGVLCSETFVSGQAPERVFARTLGAMPGGSLIGWALSYRIGRGQQDATVTLLGLGRSRAVHRAGLGCRLDHGQPSLDIALPGDAPQPSRLPDIAGPDLVTPLSPELQRALDRAFAEPVGQPVRNTAAVVIVRDGRVIAERYVDGVGIETPILGFSATKSVVSALVGILVGQGRLSRDAALPVAEWQGPGDTRRLITVDHLLRHTAGLAAGSSLSASLLSALEPVNVMKFTSADMAAHAASLRSETLPDSSWNYSDVNYVLLSRLIRRAVGDRPEDVLRFARDELFAPLGMRSVVLEFDAAGTPDGSSQMLASARDWARFGMLYLDDGMAGSRRILPQGWVDYSTAPTRDAFVGYGAGFWTNRGDSFGARYRIAHGMPADAFMAKGTLGQYVVIIPSERLVIVRLGRSPNWPPEADGTFQLVADVIAATGRKADIEKAEAATTDVRAPSPR